MVELYRILLLHEAGDRTGVRERFDELSNLYQSLGNGGIILLLKAFSLTACRIIYGYRKTASKRFSANGFHNRAKDNRRLCPEKPFESPSPASFRKKARLPRQGLKNQNHQLSWWYALCLKGKSAGSPTRALKGTCQSHLLHRLAAEAACGVLLFFRRHIHDMAPSSDSAFHALLFLLPVNGSTYSLNVYVIYWHRYPPWQYWA